VSFGLDGLTIGLSLFTTPLALKVSFLNFCFASIFLMIVLIDQFTEFEDILHNIFTYRGSVNFYMFHGGTNFGFMNGANHIEDYAKNRQAKWPYYAPDVTSYGND
jgi:hypothetical protein